MGRSCEVGRPSRKLSRGGGIEIGFAPNWPVGVGRRRGLLSRCDSRAIKKVPPATETTSALSRSCAQLRAHMNQRSGWIELQRVLGELGQLVRCQNRDPAPLQPNPSALLPNSQLLVGAFARPADNLTQLALCDR